MKSGMSREMENRRGKRKLEMFRNPGAGKLITFCGLDGCGKPRKYAGWSGIWKTGDYRCF